MNDTVGEHLGIPVWVPSLVDLDPCLDPRMKRRLKVRGAAAEACFDSLGLRHSPVAVLFGCVKFVAEASFAFAHLFRRTRSKHALAGFSASFIVAHSGANSLWACTLVLGSWSSTRSQS